jgi:hypothetical protein
MNDSSLNEGTSKDGGLDIKKLRLYSPSLSVRQLRIFGFPQPDTGFGSFVNL